MGETARSQNWVEKLNEAIASARHQCTNRSLSMQKSWPDSADSKRGWRDWRGCRPRQWLYSNASVKKKKSRNRAKIGAKGATRAAVDYYGWDSVSTANIEATFWQKMA